MLRKLIIIVLFFSVFGLQAAEGKLKAREARVLYKFQKTGMQEFHNGNYDEAYSLLTKSAEAGLKYSQYYLGLMYLKGQGVDKSYTNGMSWIGVAKESKIPEIVEMFDSLYEKFNEDARVIIDKKTTEYIKLYGMKKQFVSCKMHTPPGLMTPRIACQKITRDLQKFHF